jgi:integrase
MRRIEHHLASYVGPGQSALVFAASRGGPLFRSTFARDVWRPAVTRAGLEGFTFHGLRHSFVAIPLSVNLG